MDKKQINHINKIMAPIMKEPLQKITRAADLICFQFGDLVKTAMPIRNSDGKLVPGEGFVGKYALQVACYGRLTCGSMIVFAKGDLYQPSSDALAKLGLQAEDTLPDDFDYDIIGNNRLDEIISAKFDSIKDIEVENVTINRLGDLHIKFSNGFEFQALIDVSGPEECWRFFISGTDEHLVVTGEGLEIDNQE